MTYSFVIDNLDDGSDLVVDDNHAPDLNQPPRASVDCCVTHVVGSLWTEFVVVGEVFVVRSVGEASLNLEWPGIFRGHKNLATKPILGDRSNGTVLALSSEE